MIDKSSLSKSDKGNEILKSLKYSYMYIQMSSSSAGGEKTLSPREQGKAISPLGAKVEGRHQLG